MTFLQTSFSNKTECSTDRRRTSRIFCTWYTLKLQHRWPAVLNFTKKTLVIDFYSENSVWFLEHVFLNLKLTYTELTKSGEYCVQFLFFHWSRQRPNAEWPGAKADSTWPTIYGVDDVNSPKIEVTIHKDICGTKYTVSMPLSYVLCKLGDTA